MNDPENDPAQAGGAAPEQGEVNPGHPDSVALATIHAGLIERGLVFEAEDGKTIDVQALEVIDQLLAERDALAKAAKAAASAPRASRGTAAGRKCGPSDKLVLNTEDDRKLMLELIGDAETVEVVFSNGKSEIAGMAPVVLTGSAFRLGIAGLQLTLDELIVHGPAGGQAGFELAGYGLFLDGKPVAWRARDKLVIPPGAQMNLASDIVF